MALTSQEVADAMFEMVKEYQGKKKFKATDLTKAMLDKFGEAQCDKQLCKAGIRILMDSGRCVYTYFGGSFIEMPRAEARRKGELCLLRKSSRSISERGPQLPGVASNRRCGQSTWRRSPLAAMLAPAETAFASS